MRAKKKETVKRKFHRDFESWIWQGWSIHVIPGETNSHSQWKCQRTRWERTVSQMCVVPAVYVWRPWLAQSHCGFITFCQGHVGFLWCHVCLAHRWIKWKMSEYTKHHLCIFGIEGQSGNNIDETHSCTLGLRGGGLCTGLIRYIKRHWRTISKHLNGK